MITQCRFPPVAVHSTRNDNKKEILTELSLFPIVC